MSPSLLRETAQEMGRDPEEPWPTAEEVAKAYLKALTGNANGEVIFVDGYEM